MYVCLTQLDYTVIVIIVIGKPEMKLPQKGRKN